jgi:hypothetical protein
MRKSGSCPKGGFYAELAGIVAVPPRGDYLLSGFGGRSGMEYLRGLQRSVDVDAVFDGFGSTVRGAS